MPRKLTAFISFYDIDDRRDAERRGEPAQTEHGAARPAATREALAASGRLNAVRESEAR